ncbi:hypothetical protein EDB85DRAFT_1938075 [Lactarius pseudohatsudake]|nr:hypothetical protein EDB85DRAFT_1938075 [Lactarius pseudohatsudake]
MHWSPNPDNPLELERIYADILEGDTKEHVALGLMLASDSTQLTNFGSASVWPVYLMFANQPKQERVRPSCHAVHRIAYVPSLGQDFVSRYQQITDKAPSPAIETHRKRELMHAGWTRTSSRVAQTALRSDVPTLLSGYSIFT